MSVYVCERDLRNIILTEKGMMNVPDWKHDGGCRKSRCKRSDFSDGLACWREVLRVVVAPAGFLFHPVPCGPFQAQHH